MQLTPDPAIRILEAGPHFSAERSRPISEEGEKSDSSGSLDPAGDDQQVEDDSPWEISSHSSSDTDLLNQNRLNEAGSFLSAVAANTHTFQETPNVAPLTTDLEPFSQLARVHRSINFTINCLYKLPIRYPVTLDRLRQKSSIDTSPYQHFDILYVQDKFPKLSADVSSRLGKMITRRRQLLHLRDSHSLSLSLEPDGRQAPSVISSHHTLKTRATMLKMAEPPTEEQLYAPSISESELSIASSYTERQLKIKIPSRPKGENGDELDYFVCPYCRIAKNIKTKAQWK